MAESCMLSEYHTHNFFRKQFHEHKMLYAATQGFSFSSSTIQSMVALNIWFKNNILENVIFTESNLM